MKKTTLTSTKILVAAVLICGLMTIQAPAAPGDLDPSFGNGGKVVSSIGNGNEGASAVAIQSDGKVVVAGTDGGYVGSILARYNTDGSLDSTFGSGGTVITAFSDVSSRFKAIAIQSDGKIVAAGGGSGGDEENPILELLLARYNTDGSLDSTFGSDGKVVSTFSLPNYGANDIAIQPDGKIVAVGVGETYSGSDFFLARFNTNGSLDSSFGLGGRIINTFYGNTYFCNAVVIQRDGKIVAAGGSNGAFALVRYNIDGSLDTSFGTGGKVLTNFNSSTAAYDLVIQPDGKIVAVGTSYTTFLYFALARYNTNGSLDSTFGTSGKVVINFTAHTSARSVAIQSDGKIVAVGTSSSPGFTVVRCKTDGSLDPTFGSNGIVVTPIGNQSDYASAVVIQSDGKIVAAGNSYNGANEHFALVRYLGDSNTRRTQFDFDGDGKADISVFRPSNGTWYLQQSTNGFTGFQFGIPTDKIVPADYDGDGKTDIAVYRDGTWYLQRSRDGFLGIAFGVATDIPMPADFDGDGKAEIAVFRPSDGGWYIYNLVNGQFTSTQFGQAGDVPVAADYDGDGKADIAVYRNRTWYLLRSRDGFKAVDTRNFGQADDDKPVPADYDGDGKADIAMFRNGGWYLIRSQLGNTVIGFGFGTDLPVPADYDGDGKTDIAVFRPSNGTWYIQRSQLGFTGFAFGEANDKPVPNAFVGQGVNPIDISNFSFTPSTIDVTNSSQAVTVTLRVTDTERDVSNITVTFISPGNQYVYANLSSQNRISGNARDGVYSTTAIFPQYSKAGTWKVYSISVDDGYGYNSRVFYTSDLAARGFATELQAINNNERIPPEISDFSFTPTVINTTNSSRNITITLRAKDAISGVRSISVSFFGPAGCDYYEDECVTFGVSITSADRISGDDKDGVYRVVLTVPQNSPFGIYGASVSASDAVSNFTYLGSAQLAARGYPSQLEITSAAPAL